MAGPKKSCWKAQASWLRTSLWGAAVFLVFCMTFTKPFCFSASQVPTRQGVVGINRGGWKQRGGEQPSSSRRHWEGVVLQTLTDFPAIAQPVGFHRFPLTIAWHHFLEQNECIKPSVSSITCSYSATYFWLAMLTWALGLTLFPDQPQRIVCLLVQP